MPASKAAPAKVGAAARSRANGKVKTVKFYELTLVLPKEPPGDLAFSLENNEVSGSVREVFGNEQYLQIREKCRDKKFNYRKTYTELFDLLDRSFEEWGTDSGE